MAPITPITEWNSSRMNRGYNPRKIDIVARMSSGTLIVNGGSRILGLFANSGFIGPKKIFFAAAKV
jgi:hypothetical protein